MNDIVILKFPPYYTKREIKQLNDISPDILIFDDNFVAELVKIKFPDSIFYVNFGQNFNKILINIKLPRFLKKIKFGDGYTQSLDYVNLPKTLEILEFGSSFNNSLFSVKLPENLKELILNDIFNCALPPVLPEGLEKLFLGESFEYSVNNFIVPMNLKELKISGMNQNKPLFDNLPKTLEYLKIVNNLEFDFDYNLPVLKKLVVHDNSNILINFDKLLELEHFVCKGKQNNEKILNKLPNTIKYLEIEYFLEIDLVNLPMDLEELKINVGKTYNLRNNQQKPIPKFQIHKQTNLPMNLKKIILCDVEIMKYLKKVPYNCKVVDFNNKEIIYNEV